MNRLLLLLSILTPFSLLAAPPIAIPATNGLGFNTTISNLVSKGNTRIGGSQFNNNTITDSVDSLIAGGRQNSIDDTRTTGSANNGNVIIGGFQNKIRGGFGNVIIGSTSGFNDAVSVSTIIGEDSYITTNSDIALILGGERNKVDATGAIAIGSGITNNSDYAVILGFESTNVVINPTNASATFNNMRLNGNGAGLSNAVVIVGGTGITSTPSGNGRTYTLAATGGGGSASFPITNTVEFATNSVSQFGMTVNTNIDGNNGVGISWDGLNGGFLLWPDGTTGDVNFKTANDFMFGYTGARNAYGIGALMDSHVKSGAAVSVDVLSHELETGGTVNLKWNQANKLEAPSGVVYHGNGAGLTNHGGGNFTGTTNYFDGKVVVKVSVVLTNVSGPSNTVVLPGFVSVSGSGLNGMDNLTVTNNASIPTNTANFTVFTTDRALGTAYTIGSRRATISGSFTFNRALATDTARVSIYVDQDANGVYEDVNQTISQGPGVAASDDIFFGPVFLQPGASFYYTNRSSGSATAAIVANSFRLVYQ